MTTPDAPREGIEPALSADEWRGGELAWPTVALETTSGGRVNVWDGKEDPDSHFVTVDDADRHAIAALCLHGQPYGFTWEDVHLLKFYADSMVGAFRSDEARLRSLVTRIAALLPPR